MRSIEPVELLLLASCWWHMSLIQGNSVTSYYSRRAIPSDLRDNSKPGNNVRHMILDASEAILLTPVVRETVRLLNWFVNYENHGEDDDAGAPWENIEVNPLSLNAGNSGNRTFKEAGLSCFI